MEFIISEKLAPERRIKQTCISYFESMPDWLKEGLPKDAVVLVGGSSGITAKMKAEFIGPSSYILQSVFFANTQGSLISMCADLLAKVITDDSTLSSVFNELVKPTIDYRFSSAEQIKTIYRHLALYS